MHGLHSPLRMHRTLRPAADSTAPLEVGTCVVGPPLGTLTTMTTPSKERPREKLSTAGHRKLATLARLRVWATRPGAASSRSGGAGRRQSARAVCAHHDG